MRQSSAMRAATLLIIVLPLAALGADFQDPAPPSVQTPLEDRPAEAKQNPRVVFHQAPKPLPASAKTHDWTAFLGPTHDMVATESQLLHDLPPGGPVIIWEMQTGSGYSAPAVQGDRLVFLERRGDEEVVEALRADTGELFWEYRYPSDFEDRYGYNNGPRASPVIDDDRVYTYGSQGKLHCFRLSDGSLLWKRDIAAEFQVPQDFFGVASTPLIEGDLLIVTVGAPGGPTVAAFDKRTGRMKWGAGEEWGAGYASPIPAVVHGKRVLFVFAGGESRPPTGGLMLIDPDDGKVHATFPWRSKSYESVNAASPVVVGDQVFISATYRTGGVLLDVAPDLTVKPAWRSDDFDLHFTTAIAHDGYLYAFAGRNEPDASLMAVNIATGETAWDTVLEWPETVRINGTAREIYMSPYRAFLLKVDGSFLVLGEQGQLMWLDLTPKEPKILSKATLFLSRQNWTPPVVSKGLLYITQNERDFLSGKPPRLICYDFRAAD